MRDFMIALLVCSITMSALAFFYMAITPFLKNYFSEKGRYYAWLIIIIGLIIPFRPQFNYAIVQIDIPTGTTTSTVQVGNETVFTIPDNNIVPVDIIPGDNPALLPTTTSFSWWQIAVAVWLAGVIVFLTFYIIKHYRFVKLAKRWSENVTDERSLSLLQSLQLELRISKVINLYQYSDLGSPMMFGFVNPRILLPKKELAEDELRFILKHELVHYKRKDLYFKLLVLIATAIHWFNPFVYLIAKAINAQCELSCDAEIVRNADADTRLQYSETIIGVIKYRSKLKTVLSTNFYGGKKGMKNRVSSIMDARKKRIGVIIISLVLIATLFTGFAFSTNANQIDTSGISNELTAQYSTPTPITNERLTEQRIAQFEPYKEFGLIYIPLNNQLYYNGELVRFFNDKIYISTEIGEIEITHFDENGAVDVYTVRADYSLMTYRPDGARDLYSTLLELERASQAEFDAKDIEHLKNSLQSQPTAHASSSLPIESIDNNFSMQADPNAPMILPIDNIDNTAYANNQGTGMTLADIYSGINNFGVTFDGNLFNGGTGNIYHNGKVVRTLNDNGVWLSSSDRSGSINIRVIRDDNGIITGIEVLEI